MKKKYYKIICKNRNPKTSILEMYYEVIRSKNIAKVEHNFSCQLLDRTFWKAELFDPLCIMLYAHKDQHCRGSWKTINYHFFINISLDI